MAKTERRRAEPRRGRKTSTKLPRSIELAVRAAEDKKAQDITVMDLRNAHGFTDYFDFIIHVFSPEARAFYGLERLWGAADRVDVPSTP